jgi:hypothetical protein
MKILLDENVHHGFRKILESHEVYTVQFMGWTGVKNGNLLKLADGKFDLLITLDTGILYENDFTGLNISVITLISKSVQFKDLLPLVPRLLTEINQIKPGKIVNIKRS